MPIPAGLFNLHARRARHKLRLQRWAGRGCAPARSVVLDRRTIFILPSRQGLAFALVLLLILIAAINYEASLALALVFLLASAAFLSIFHAYRNLSGLELASIPSAPVFAGEICEFTVRVRCRGSRGHAALQLSLPGSEGVQADLLELRETRVRLYQAVQQRGRFRPGRLTVQTLFPLGIWRAWAWPALQLSCLVYPQPVSCDLQGMLGDGPGPGPAQPGGAEDFHGLREYRRGDSLRHVAWKHFARGQGMLTRQLESDVENSLWLDWDGFSPLDTEARLSRLSFCARQLHGADKSYGLRLPGLEILPGCGVGHYHQVLEALALYEPQEQPE